MLNLIGTYECKVDAKGRLALPMGLRKQLGDITDEGFVLKRSVFQPCLELYPMSEWNNVMQQVGKLNRFKQKNNEFIRRFSAGVKPVDIDSSGRVQIAKDLVAFANIDKEVVVSSAINIIEIWDKELYEKAVNPDDMDFAALAEEVMGNEDDNDIS
ncbi:division/cell wall cluster transcriptional repressor MraZ [Weeksellaceae bacterium KMM 9713]|uniref:Transcriptional regulator MraZ n=1 Tax=Profundicola chukchiensis TaxID=2961959 RepID=A0A9X4MVW6_9FLAO|nr:division/cell wall cluster transcriptional repressor MraZ [Profundicola chukchiensis]MDG4945033.1 division/cell wall cluster transcriptional repressor MraZ [Profundicola chukchiensis]MDG4950115.1 division/cell wall cluster transcriptional repressor MraZ [Profundicola chukchiensis]